MLRHKHLFVFLALAPLLAHAQDARDPRDPRDPTDPRDPRDDPPVVETEEEECVRSCSRIDAILDELPTIEARDTLYRFPPLYSKTRTDFVQRPAALTLALKIKKIKQK